MQKIYFDSIFQKVHVKVVYILFFTLLYICVYFEVVVVYVHYFLNLAVVL